MAAESIPEPPAPDHRQGAVDRQGALDREGAAGRKGAADAWGAFGLVLSGIGVWGGVGAALGAWWGSAIPVLVGLLVGMTGGLYLVWFRYGRA